MRHSPIGLLLSLAVLFGAACGGAGGGATPSAAVPQGGTLIGGPASVATLTTAQLDAMTAKSGQQAQSGTARCDVSVFSKRITRNAAQEDHGRGTKPHCG